MFKSKQCFGLKAKKSDVIQIVDIQHPTCLASPNHSLPLQLHPLLHSSIAIFSLFSVAFGLSARGHGALLQTEVFGFCISLPVFSLLMLSSWHHFHSTLFVISPRLNDGFDCSQSGSLTAALMLLFPSRIPEKATDSTESRGG